MSRRSGMSPKPVQKAAESQRYAGACSPTRSARSSTNSSKNSVTPTRSNAPTHEVHGRLLIVVQRLHLPPIALARECQRHAGLAVVGVAPEAQWHAVVDEFTVPRDVMQKWMSNQRHEVAAAASAAEFRSEQQQIGQWVPHEARLRATSTVYLDGKPQTVEPSLSEQGVEAVQYNLQLHPAVASHVREELKVPSLCLPL
eukprot:6539520-Prymnesium_polylepis.1